MIQHGPRDDRNETFILLPSKKKGGIQVLCYANKSLEKKKSLLFVFRRLISARSLISAIPMGRLYLVAPPVSAVQAYLVEEKIKRGFVVLETTEA